MPIKIRPLAAASTLAFAAAFGMFVATAHAAGPAAVSARDGWVRWLPSGLPAAGYVTLSNAGDKPVDLIGVSSADYSSAMLHRTVSKGSSETMMMVDRLTIPARGNAVISPGNYHLMLMQATHKIAPGDTVHLQLKFSDGETLDAPFIVKPPSQTK
jgi:copper(I)-binding protein